MNDHVDQILIKEMEAVLDAAGFPHEADVAVLYVRNLDGFKTSRYGERIAGIPGSGEAIVWGPILLGFLVSVTTDFLIEAKKKAVEVAAQGALDYLVDKFKLKRHEKAPISRKW